MTTEDRLERAANSGHWTIGALHDHIDRRFSDLEKRIDDRFSAQEKATASALASAEKAVEKAERLATTRAAQQNEWRDTVNDLINTMMPRAEYIAAQTYLVEKVNDLGSRMSCDEGAGRRTDTIVPWIIAAVGAIVAIVSLLVSSL